MAKTKIVMVCNKCGNTMPIDKDKSTPNWVVYMNTCTCGGKGTVSMVK